MCTTCGYMIPTAQSAHGVTDGLGPHPKTQRSGFWRKFFGLDEPPEEHKEPGQEEPALG